MVLDQAARHPAERAETWWAAFIHQAVPSSIAGSGGSGSGSSGSSAPLSHDHYERLFLYCATWSLGGLLDAKERPRFDAHLRSLTDQAPEKVGAG